MSKEIVSVQGLCEIFFCTLKFTSILTKNTELMSCSSNEFETFRSKNNTGRRHYYFFIPSLGPCGPFVLLYPITLFVSGWPLRGR
jgi:hypothetical protein